MNKQLINIFLIAIPVIALLQGCAHSAAQRQVTNDVDASHSNLVQSFADMHESNLIDVYQNSTQTTKGTILGGAGGALAGWLSSGIGILPGAASGAILGGSIGAYIDANTTIADKLENRRAKVFVLGDQVRIILPSQTLFDERTPNFLPTAYSTLDLVAQLINTYPNMSVEVAAYTGSSSPPAITNALTREQANNIVKYLRQKNVNTRVLYAVGAGGSHLVGQDSADWAANENYRIEISLEKLPV